MENEKETKKVKPSEPKKPTFLEKLLAVQMEMEAATRGSNNPFYKSKYADLNSKETKKVKPSEPKKPTFLEKLLAVQMEMEAATRGSNNPFYKSKYADLNS